VVPGDKEKTMGGKGVWNCGGRDFVGGGGVLRDAESGKKR